MNLFNSSVIEENRKSKAKIKMMVKNKNHKLLIN